MLPTLKTPTRLHLLAFLATAQLGVGRTVLGGPQLKSTTLPRPQYVASFPQEEEFDRSAKGAVTEVKDQRDLHDETGCASSAFGFVAGLEGAYSIKYGLEKAVPFSERQLVECSPKYGFDECKKALRDLMGGKMSLNADSPKPEPKRTVQCKETGVFGWHWLWQKECGSRLAKGSVELGVSESQHWHCRPGHSDSQS